MGNGIIDGEHGLYGRVYNNVGRGRPLEKKNRLSYLYVLQPFSMHCRITDTGTHFNKLGGSPPKQNFTKSANWQPSCSLRTNGQTNITKPIFAFRNFVNAPGTKGQTKNRTKINNRPQNKGSGNGATPVTHLSN
jgi:hypothetical protein